ncbi:MAG: hypothetical protein JWR52_3199 [Marmoricola sp.]|nr:hypothetical protein [Marmoricola sp.]
MRDPILGAVGGLLYRPPWFMNVYPDAGEAGGGYLRPSKKAKDATRPRLVAPVPSARSAIESAARSARRVRRYCAANRLTVMGTLTYAGTGCHDQAQIRSDLGEFFRALRDERGRGAFPYLWVPEWHKTDHGLHAHFGVDRRIPVGLIREIWGHGHVFMRQRTGRPSGGSALNEARHAAGYLSKYLSKSLNDTSAAIAWQHRYDVAQGFDPKVVRVEGWSRSEAIGLAIQSMGGVVPASTWVSDDAEVWDAPPRVVLRWD